MRVVDPNTNTVVGSIPVGFNPRGIAFTADGSRAYVAHFFSNAVAVIDVVGCTLTSFVTVGNNRWNVAITPTGIAYVANFGDNIISVFDTSTNAVTATLNSRIEPADVIVTTTPRPRILNYSFQAFDPPGFSGYRSPRDQQSRSECLRLRGSRGGALHESMERV